MFVLHLPRFNYSSTRRTKISLGVTRDIIYAPHYPLIPTRKYEMVRTHQGWVAAAPFLRDAKAQSTFKTLLGGLVPGTREDVDMKEILVGHGERTRTGVIELLPKYFLIMGVCLL